jgi:hypothetical protein
VPTLPKYLEVQATDVAAAICQRLRIEGRQPPTRVIQQIKGGLLMTLFDRVMANIVMVVFTVPLVVIAVRLLLAQSIGDSK